MTRKEIVAQTKVVAKMFKIRGTLATTMWFNRMLNREEMIKLFLSMEKNKQNYADSVSDLSRMNDQKYAEIMCVVTQIGAIQ